MTALRTRFIEELRLRGRSENTIDIYVRSVRQLSEHYKRNLLLLTDQEVRSYLLSMLDRGIAVKTYNVSCVAIRRFFAYCATPPRTILSIKIIRDPFSLPDVLSQEEVKSLLDCVTSLKYKTILSLMYSAGLRVGESTRLRVEDIDSDRMLIHIRQSKGNKDRFVILGQTALALLREYYLSYRPKSWLFVNDRTGKPLHVRSIQHVFTKAVADAKINKIVRPHTLRHSFATHLLEQRCSLPVIQNLLGHQNIKSTLIYTHITPAATAAIINPLDAITSKTEVHRD
jgi:site-specific recombinase XerD